MNTFIRITSWLLSRALLLLFVLLTSDSYASEVLCYNKSSATVRLKVMLYESDYPVVSIGTIDSLFVAPNTFLRYDAPDVPFIRVQAYLDTGSGDVDKGTTSFLSGDSGRVITYYNETGYWGGQTSVSAPSSTVSQADAIDVFKSGFYLSISIGITALIWSLLRSMGRQNHLPS